MAQERKKRRARVSQGECVACGCCVKVCPVGALEVFRGLYASVSGDRCPASVIGMQEETV